MFFVFFNSRYRRTFMISANMTAFIVCICSYFIAGNMLAFIIFPQTGSMITFPRFWTIIGLVMLFAVGCSCHVINIETIIFDIMRCFRLTKGWWMKITVAVCVAVFLISLSMANPGGLHVLNLLLKFGCGIAYFAGFTLSAFAIKIYGKFHLTMGLCVLWTLFHYSTYQIAFFTYVFQ